MRAPTVVPDWARGASRRRRILSRRNICFGIAGLLVLGFLVWLNFPFIPDPIILLTRQPADIFASSSVGDQWRMAGRTVGQTRHAADALTVPEGRLVWSADTGPATLAAPVISDNLIFLPGHFRIAVLNPETGVELDSISTTGPMHNSVAIAQGNIYYATIDRRVVAMDAETHQQRWEYPIGDSSSGPVAVAGGIVYAGGLDGVTYAVNAVTGEHIWRHSSLSEVRSPAAVGNRIVYVASADRSLYALDARTGQERARFRSSAQLVAAPVLANELVYFVSGGQLFAMDANVIEFPGRYAVTRVWAQLWLWGSRYPPLHLNRETAGASCRRARPSTASFQRPPLRQTDYSWAICSATCTPSIQLLVRSNGDSRQRTLSQRLRWSSTICSFSAINPAGFTDLTMPMVVNSGGWAYRPPFAPTRSTRAGGF